MDNYPTNETLFNQTNGYNTSSAGPKTSGFAMASMICGIISILLCCTGCFSLSLGSLSILFAVLSKRRGEPMPSMSVTGITLSCVGIALGIFILIFSFATLISSPEFRESYEDALEEYYEYYNYGFEDLDFTGGAL